MKAFHLISLFVLIATMSWSANPEDFTVNPVGGGSPFSLKSARGEYVAVHFLLKTECPVCLRHTNDYISRSSTLPGVKQIFLKPDGEKEIQSWAGKLTGAELKEYPIYRDPDAKLAEAFSIPGGYAFHGQVVHYPALVLIGPDGKEVFRYVGKNNGDRYGFDQLVAKVKELKAAK